MTNATERQQRRDLRGTLLRAARDVFGRSPDTVTIRGLERAAAAYDWNDAHAATQAVAEEIAYLVGVQYLEAVPRQQDALDKPLIVYRLTAKGYGLINGDFADASIGL